MSSGKVKCTCGWSWNKSDSSKKDMYICHECGRDNSNNMKNGGWLDNYNDSEVSLPEGYVGEGYDTTGRNYSPAWGGQFEDGGLIPMAQKGKIVKPIYVDSKNDPRYRAYQDSLRLYNYGKTIPNSFSGEKVITKKEFIKKNNIEKTFKYYDIKGDDFEKDSKSKKNKPFKNYYKERGISPNYEKDVEKAKQEIINTNFEPLIDNKKLYTDGIYRGDKSYMTDKDYSQFQYDPVTGTTIQNVYLNDNGKQSKQTGLMSSNKIKPIGVTYTAYDNPHTYDMIQSNNEKVENKTFGLHINPYYKKPTTPVVVDKNNYNPNDPRLIDLQKRLENTLLKPQQKVITDKKPTQSVEIRPNTFKDNKGNIVSTGDNKPTGRPQLVQVLQREKTDYINNLTPYTNNNNSEISAQPIQIQQEVRLPEYYDVTDTVNQNFGGTETKYRWYPSDGQPLPQISSEVYDDGSPYNSRSMTPRYQMGGSVYPVNYVPQAQNGKLTFLQPTSDKLPEGYRIPYADPSSERAMSIGGENDEPAYLIPSFKYGQPLYNPIEEFKKTGEHLGGPFKNWMDAEKWEQDVRHPAVERRENIMFPQEQFAMGGSIPGAVGFSYARTNNPAPSNGKYAKKTMASAQDGNVIKDDRGQWAHPGEITEIGSNNITMEGVPYDVLGISDTGDTKLMKPGKNYKFNGKKVTEYPMAKNGTRQEQKGLVNLNQLTNFTNYNTKQPGGWMDELM